MRYSTKVLAALFFLDAVGFGIGRLQAEEPAIPVISTFAPAADLIQQVDFFLGRVEESLADPQDFDAAKQSRTFKDANTLAVLGLMLAVHDQDHAVKGAAAMNQAAQALAAAGEDAAMAREALGKLRAARQATGQEGSVTWGKTASLPALMKQVPLVHTGLKRGVDPARLKRQAAQAAGQSAALAAMAEAALLDPEYATNADDATAWRAMCAEMRDAAGEVNSAIHALDEARIAAGMKRLTLSCDACHAKFRGP